MNFGFDNACLLAEQTGATVAPIPTLQCLLAASLLERFASRGLCEQLLPGVVADETLLALALSEPGNDEATRPSCALEEHADKLVLRGEKHLVAYAVQADHLILTATYGNEPALLIVPAQADGLTIHAQQTTTDEPTYKVQFHNIIVDSSARLLCGTEAINATRWLVEHALVASTCMVVLM